MKSSPRQARRKVFTPAARRTVCFELRTSRSQSCGARGRRLATCTARIRTAAVPHFPHQIRLYHYYVCSPKLSLATFYLAAAHESIVLIAGRGFLRPPVPRSMPIHRLPFTYTNRHAVGGKVERISSITSICRAVASITAPLRRSPSVPANVFPDRDEIGPRRSGSTALYLTFAPTLGDRFAILKAVFPGHRQRAHSGALHLCRPRTAGAESTSASTASLSITSAIIELEAKLLLQNGSTASASPQNISASPICTFSSASLKKISSEPVTPRRDLLLKPSVPPRLHSWLRGEYPSTPRSRRRDSSDWAAWRLFRAAAISTSAAGWAVERLPPSQSSPPSLARRATDLVYFARFDYLLHL